MAPPEAGLPPLSLRRISMYVAVMQVELRLPSPESLKDKRRILLPLTTRLKRRFEVAVSEVGDHDDWHISTLGLALVSPDARHARQRMDAVLRHLEEQFDFEVTDHQIEIL